jgi:fucose permease
MAALLGCGLGLVALAGDLGRLELVPVGAGLLGFGLAGLGVCANYYVAVATPVVRRARSLARLHVTYAAASILVPVIVGRAALAWPWPRVILGAALVPLALLPISLLVPRVRPAPGAGPAPASGERFHLGTILVYALAVSLFVVAEVSISAWLCLYAERATDYSSATRPLLLAGFFLGLGTARALGGTFLRTEHVRRAIALAAVATAAAALLGLHVDALFLPVTGLGAGLLFPTTISALTLELPRAQHAMAIAIVTAAYSLALALSHASLGFLSDRYGIAAALHVSPACALLGIGVLGAFAWRRPRANS